MPSPPAEVSSDHHEHAAAHDAASPVSACTCRVSANSAGSAATSRAAAARCQECGRAACVAPSDASTWNGATRTPSRPATGQQYRW